MVTRNRGLLFAAAVLVAGGALAGCEKKLDPEQYGEILTDVPPELDKPFPLPQLEESEKGPPAAETPASSQEVTK